MAGWSQTIIIGNVGRDPRFNYTPNGVAVCDFSVAVTRRIGRRDDPNRTEKTTWFRVTCWRQLAEIAKDYVRKGTQIMVVGTIDASAYTDRSGQPVASLELTADTFQLLGSRADAEARAGGVYDDFAPPPDDVGEIPF